MGHPLLLTPRIMFPTGTHLTAFEANRLVASGAPDRVAVAVAQALAADPGARALVFDDATGRPVDLDLRGDADAIRARYAATGDGGEAAAVEPRPRKGPGRPRLGVVSKEVTLLPRHWAWLAAQRGGASATLRRLVEDARKRGARRGEVRRAQDAAFRFMSALGGDLPGYEEGLRALFAGDAARFAAELEGWPPDVRAYSMKLAANAFDEPSSGADAD